MLRLASLVASVAVLALSAAQEDGPSTCQRPRLNNRVLMLVSTMDGQVSALNVKEQGHLEWAVDAGAAPLVSSSIDKLEISRNGVLTRLIPSLDGAVYQFDGDSIEAMPFTADTLLSSSFKFSDDSIVVGGKEFMTYGVDLNSGEVVYVCSMSGCNRKRVDSVGETGDVLVINRQSRTVRAIELKTGMERWNFSVGHHEVAYLGSGKDDGVPHLTQGQADPSMYDEDGYVSTCEENEEDGYGFELPSWLFEEGGEKLSPNIQLRVLVPNGVVLAVDMDQPNNILWQHKFSSPIADAWTLQDGKLVKVDLFDDRNVPALGVGPNEEEGQEEGRQDLEDQPLLYIGLHENQMYVQPSVQMHEEVCGATGLPGAGPTDVTAVDMPRVRWQPYLATAPSRTPAITGVRNPLQITWDSAPEEQNAVSPWQEQYPFDGGYYLYRDTSPYQRYPPALPYNKTRDKDFIYGGDITMSLWIYWREILVITCITAVFVHWLTLGVIRARLSRMQLDRSTSQQVMSTLAQTRLLPEMCTGNGSADKAFAIDLEKAPGETGEKTENNNKDYVSRYREDFEQVTCLGKGGFGVVFEAKNRVDDCSYAIKRIALNNSERAREKVMREVKALAKLDNSGIVRYYQAWFECPPPGWQEERDREVDELASATPTVGYTTDLSPSPIPESENLSDIYIDNKPKVTKATKMTDINPLNPFRSHLPFSTVEEGESGSTEWSEYVQIKRNSSGGFVPQGDVETMETDESGSYSLGVGSPGQLNDVSESVDIVFSNSDSEAVVSQSGDGPWVGGVSNTETRQKGGYHGKLLDSRNDSFSVVFEDSGCGEKGSNEEIFAIEDHGKDHCEEHSGLSGDTDNVRCGHSDPEDDSFPGAKSTQSKESSTSGVVVAFFLHSSDSGKSPHVLAMSHSTEENDGNQAIPWSADSPSPVGSAPGASRPSNLDLASRPHHPTAAGTPILPTPKIYLYIQMQLCRRHSLKEWLSSNTLRRDHQEVLDIFDQITSAVDYVHDCNLMHRDLKPSNIFFSMDGSVKVGDFGLVTPIEEGGDSSPQAETESNREDKRHTSQVGTKLYMSPEQAAGKHYCRRVDIYALGLILFELFYPFTTQMERVTTMLDVRKQRFPARFVRELPNVSKFVRQLLDADPEKRPSTKEILANDLLHEFNAARQASTRVRSRTRTSSSSSSDSLGKSFSKSH